ncbi:MAG: tetratricopeptide repeat protein [Dehalococcoidia bacterium]|nr:tetratricopeptide repeat protein [Dehalococcoidia bacterium]
MLGSREVTPAAVASSLVSEIEARTQTFFAVVLDDYHELDDSEPVNQIVDLLLTYLPEQCRVIVASRTIPGHLRLSRLAAQSEVAGIGAAELAFTQDEVAGLLRARGHGAVSEEQAAQWHLTSHGWAAALVLSTDVDAPLGAEKITSPRQLLSFLSDEVVGRLPGHLQQFLLQTSLLNPVTAAGADALLGLPNADLLLGELTSHELLVQRPDSLPAAYHYHPLLRDHLANRLRSEDPMLFAILSGRAAKLAEAAGSLDAAMSHYLEGAHYAEVAALLQQRGHDLMDQGRWVALRGWCEALPSEYWSADPHLLMLLARVLQRTGDTDRAIGHARRAASLAEAENNPALSAAALLSAARILGQRSEFTEAEDLARQALGLLPLNEIGLRAEAHEVRGLCLRHLGKTPQALTELNHARRFAQETGQVGRQAAVERNLASVHLAASNLEQAETHYRAAFALWQQQGDEPLQAAALNGLGSVESSRGDYVASLAHFQQALLLAQTARTHPHLEAVILWNLAVDLRELRRFDEALSATADGLALAKQAGDNWLLARLYATESDCTRGAGRLLEAERAGQAALRWARYVKSPEVMGVALATLGAVALARGENGDAVKHLAAAAKHLKRAHALPARARTLLRQVLVEVAGQRDGNADAIARDLHKLTTEVELGFTLTVEGAEFIHLLQDAVEQRVGGEHLQNLLVRSEEWLGRSRPESPLILRQQPAPTPRLQAFAFGEARVLKDGAVVTSSQWGTAVAREMFFLLLLHPNGLRREQIIASLWPDTALSRATSQFHSTLYRM